MKWVILRTCPPAAQKSRLLGACVQMMCNVSLVLVVREESGFNLHSAGTTCRSRASKGHTVLRGISLSASCSFSKEEAKWERTFLGSFPSSSLFFFWWGGQLGNTVWQQWGKGPRSSKINVSLAWVTQSIAQYQRQTCGSIHNSNRKKKDKYD